MIMRRDVNLGLFILMIATLICFAAFTAYYQHTFEKVSTEYKDKLAELNKVTNDLQSQREKLNQTSYELKIKVDREVDLSEKYDSVKDERDKFEQDKNYLENELETTTAQLSQKEAQLLQARSDLLNTQEDLETANSRVDSLEDDVDDLCNTVHDLGGSDSICN